MADETTIGTARIDIIVNTDQFNTAVTRAKTLTTQMGESGEAAYQKLNSGAKAATTNLLKWAEGLGRTTEEQKLLNAAVRGVPVEALEAARKAILGQREAAQAAKQAALDQAEAQKAAARIQAEAAVEAERRTQQEAAARQKLVAQNTAAFRAEQANQQRLAQLRADALHAFGPELAARERENAEIQRSNAVRERLSAFLATERGQRIQEAEAIRNQSTAYTNMASVQSRAFGSTAKSAKELQFAMRQVPAQLTDITVGLASGQRPLMVLLQQGGQLKDVFGGIVPAAKALGSSLLGLINPFTVSAAAATALLVAWKQGSDEAVAYNKALISTGNYAGETASHLGELARSISQSTDATQHAVADTLAQVAASGKFTGQQLDSVGRAAIAMSTLTGQATEETVRQFEEIGKKPVEAILKLNDAQHFLTQETYAQIKALDDQGRSQEAAALAMKTYSDTLQDRAKEVVDNAGTMERAWHAVATEAKKAWDAMLDVGRPESGDDKLGRLQREANAAAIALQNLQKNGPQSGGFGLNLEGKYYYDSQLKQAKDRAAATLKAYRDEEKRQEAEQQKARADALKARLTQDRADSDREAQGYYTNAQKRAQEYLKAENEFNERIARAMKAGDSKLAERERQQKASVLAGINSKYEDKSAARQASAFSSPILDTADLSKISRDYVSSVYKRLDADKAAMMQQAQNVVSLNQYKAAMDARIATDREAAKLQVESIGLSQHEIEIRQQKIAIEREADRDLAKLNHDFADKSLQMTRADYDARLQVIKDGEAERLKIVDQTDRQVTAAMGDWSLGAQKAIADFERAGSDVAGQMHDAFASAFDGLGDAIAKFVQTGKLDFSELADSIIADLARMEARIIVSRALQSIFGGGQGASFSGDTTNSGATAGPYNALGGVYSGAPDLSRYSGMVVSTPTFFSSPSGSRMAFANGGNVMGEAGPEAIMPLRRGPDGKLGVAASGGGGDVQVVIENHTGVQPQVSRSTGPDGRDTIRVLLKQVDQRMAENAANTGSSFGKAMQSTYGLQRRGVPVGS